MYVNSGIRRLDAIKAETDGIKKQLWFQPEKLLGVQLAKVDLYLKALNVCHSWTLSDWVPQNRKNNGKSLIRRDQAIDETNEDTTASWNNVELGELLKEAAESVMKPGKLLEQGTAIRIDQADKLDCLSLALDWLWPCFDYVNERMRFEFHCSDLKEQCGDKLSKEELRHLRLIRRVFNTADRIYNLLLKAASKELMQPHEMQTKEYVLTLANRLAEKANDCVEPALHFRHPLTNKWFFRCTETERLLAPVQIECAKAKEKHRLERIADADRDDLEEQAIEQLCITLLGPESTFSKTKGNIVPGMPGHIGVISTSVAIEEVKAGREVRYPKRHLQMTLVILPIVDEQQSKAEPIALECLPAYMAMQLLTGHSAPRSRCLYLPELSSEIDTQRVVVSPIELKLTVEDQCFAVRVQASFIVSKNDCGGSRILKQGPTPEWTYISYTHAKLFKDVQSDFSREETRKAEMWGMPIGKPRPDGLTTQDLGDGGGITLVFSACPVQPTEWHFNDLTKYDLLRIVIAQFADIREPEPAYAKCDDAMLEVMVMETFHHLDGAPTPITFKRIAEDNKEMMELQIDASQIAVDDRIKQRSHQALLELHRRRSVYLKCFEYSQTANANQFS